MSSGPPRIPDFDSFDWGAEESEAQDLFSQVDPLEPVPSDPSASATPPPVMTEPEPPPPPVQGPPAAEPSPGSSARRMAARRSATRWRFDPFFAFVVLLGLSFGLTPLATGQPNGRYAILWTALALVVLASRVLEDGTLEVRLHREQLMWGAGWGLVVGLPLLLVGPRLLADVSERMFIGVPDGVVFQIIVFVMATTESAFFRGLLQASHSLLLTAALASAWSILMFFPTMDVMGFPSIALIAGTFIVLLNILYSYVRDRNGAAAAWVTQTIVSLAWLFIPRLQF